MNQQSNFQLPAFFLSAPAPCPYLEGKQERKLFTYLVGEDANARNHHFAQAGFRRSGSITYRPACADCHACQSARIVVADFVPSASFKRTMRRNQNVAVQTFAPRTTDEQFALLRRYLAHRHANGEMAELTRAEYAAMIEETHVDSYLVEYRTDDTLIACVLIDRMYDGFSLIYSFFDPARARQSLGNFIILDHIRRAQDANLPYIYLGYLVEKCQKMSYKKRFQPLQILTRDGWTRYEERTI